MGLKLKIKTQVFNPYNVGAGCLPVDRSGRPTCTDVHAAQAGRPVDRPGRPLESKKWPRSTARELWSLEMAPIDRAVDRQRAVALCILSRSTGRLTGGTTVIKMTVAPVDQKGKTALCLLPTGRIVWGYIYPIPLAVLEKF